MRPDFAHEYLNFGPFQMIRVGRNVTFGEVRQWLDNDGWGDGWRPQVEREGADLYFKREGHEQYRFGCWNCGTSFKDRYDEARCTHCGAENDWRNCDPCAA